MKVAAKVGAGLDLTGMSEYLSLLKAGIGEELANHALDEEALGRVVAGEDIGDGDAAERAQTLSRTAYESLEEFMKKQESRKTARGFVDFEEEMKEVDNGNHGTVWVSNGNVQKWLDSLPKTRPAVVRCGPAFRNPNNP